LGTLPAGSNGRAGKGPGRCQLGRPYLSSSFTMASYRSLWVASAVQLRDIAKRIVARCMEMARFVPKVSQSAEYVLHSCPLIIDGLSIAAGGLPSGSTPDDSGSC
jgi:hypothetical protein